MTGRILLQRKVLCETEEWRKRKYAAGELFPGPASADRFCHPLNLKSGEILLPLSSQEPDL
jgi:hypothetical protein